VLYVMHTWRQPSAPATAVTLFVTAIGRTLIPRYFRSIFEGGVTDLYYNLKHPKESFHTTSVTMDCDQCTMVTHHGKPMFTKVLFRNIVWGHLLTEDNYVYGLWKYARSVLRWAFCCVFQRSFLMYWYNWLPSTPHTVLSGL
jgi:hypothetical protein